MNRCIRTLMDRYEDMVERYKSNVKLETIAFAAGEKSGVAKEIFGNEFVLVLDKLMNTDLAVPEIAKIASEETGKRITADRIRSIVYKIECEVWHPSWYRGDRKIVNHEDILAKEKANNIEKVDNEIRKFINRYGIEEAAKIFNKYLAEEGK